jgi:hypothetical protein
MIRRRGFKLWELIVVMVVLAGGLYLFVQADEKLRGKNLTGVQAQNLQDIARACDHYHDAHQQWPTRAEDLQSYLTRPGVFEALRDGRYIVVWSTCAEKREDSTAHILVYEKQATVSGGYVYFRDGYVEYLKPEQAREALSAPKE